jgi:hypothetical protein
MVADRRHLAVHGQVGRTGSEPHTPCAPAARRRGAGKAWRRSYPVSAFRSIPVE